MFRNKKDSIIHFIGIGGIGMSGIAEVLIRLGHNVSGSDLGENLITENLKKLGAKVYKGHNESNIDKNTSVVVYSSAIDDSNPEVIKAKQEKIPLIRRAEMLAELMRLKYGVAVAGTHGKTTTTSFLATILHESGIDPTHIIGGVVSNLGGNARLGKSEFLVAEADESDGSFLLLNPVMSVITNIDDDHLDFYGDKKNLFEAFIKFANKVPFYGIVALNAHDPDCLRLTEHLKRPWLLFGIEENLNSPTNLDFAAKKIQMNGQGSEFDLYYKNEKIDRLKIHLPGEHNVLNALGAISLAHNLGVSFKQIKEAIIKFDGVGRRFETLREVSPRVIDDYGHHPTEIAKTIQTACNVFDDEIYVVFEPHRFTRTKQCWKEFMHCFNGAKKVFVLPIYAASESPIDGINSEFLVRDLNKMHPDFAYHLDGKAEFKALIEDPQYRDKTFLTLGAGQIGREIRSIITQLI